METPNCTKYSPESKQLNHFIYKKGHNSQVLMQKLRKKMRVLGIESSCDETGVAIYDTEKGLLAHRLFSQIAMHAEYGGVVPELASRDHIRKTLPLVEEVLNAASLTTADIDAVAYFFYCCRWLGILFDR